MNSNNSKIYKKHFNNFLWIIIKHGGSLPSFHDLSSSVENNVISKWIFICKEDPLKSIWL
jgi:hypothetical protein